MAAGIVQKGHAIAALVVGVLECVLSLIVIICSFVMAGKAKLGAGLTPYWAGIPFLIPGILGIATGITKNRCCMIANMVLNIICLVLQGVGTILVAIVMAFWAAIAAVVSKHVDTKCRTVGNECQCEVKNKWETVRNVTSCDVVSTIISLMYVIIAMLIISCIVALAGSIIGCASVCCSGGTQPATVIVQQQPVAFVNQPAGQPVYTSQPGVVQEAPPGYAEKH